MTFFLVEMSGKGFGFGGFSFPAKGEPSHLGFAFPGMVTAGNVQQLLNYICGYYYIIIMLILNHFVFVYSFIGRNYTGSHLGKKRVRNEDE